MLIIRESHFVATQLRIDSCVCCRASSTNRFCVCRRAFSRSRYAKEFFEILLKFIPFSSRTATLVPCSALASHHSAAVRSDLSTCTARRSWSMRCIDSRRLTQAKSSSRRLCCWSMQRTRRRNSIHSDFPLCHLLRHTNRVTKIFHVQ